MEMHMNTDILMLVLGVDLAQFRGHAEAEGFERY